jgi:hypothetical protein
MQEPQKTRKSAGEESFLPSSKGIVLRSQGAVFPTNPQLGSGQPTGAGANAAGPRHGQTGSPPLITVEDVHAIMRRILLLPRRGHDHCVSRHRGIQPAKLVRPPSACWLTQCSCLPRSGSCSTHLHRTTQLSLPTCIAAGPSASGVATRCEGAWFASCGACSVGDAMCGFCRRTNLTINMTRHRRLGGVHDGFYSALFHRPAAGGSSLFEDLVGILRDAAGDAEVPPPCIDLTSLPSAHPAPHAQPLGGRSAAWAVVMRYSWRCPVQRFL